MLATSKPVRVPIATRTRDGMPSMVAEQLAAAERAAAIAVTVQEAITWAVDNKIELRETNRLSQINEARAGMDLPPFRILRDEPGRTTPIATPARPPGGSALLAANQTELLDLVTGFDGTRTAFVTGEIADWLLALNTHNRPLNKTTVARFVDILKEERWLNTGEPIIVSKDGILNDGQHRLHGIRESGIGAVCDVRFGIARAAFGVTGTGTKRTAGNVLSIAGHRSATTQAGIARLLWIHDNRMMARHKLRIDTDVVLHVVEQEPLVARVAEKIQRFTFAPARNAPFGMVLVVAARHAPFDQVMEFADIAAGGLCQDEDMAPRRLHIRLRDEALSRRRLSQLDMAILTARAWNAWTTRRPLSRLLVSDEDRTSDGFPHLLPMVTP